MMHFTAFICLNLIDSPRDKRAERNPVPLYSRVHPDTNKAHTKCSARRSHSAAGAGEEQMENKAQLANLQLLWKASQLFLAISDVF